MSDNDDYELAEWEEADAPAGAGNAGTAAIEIIGKVFEYAREKTITEREIKRYRAMRDVAITEITERYKFAHALMKKTFAERRRVIEKQFEVIDKGLEMHDYQLVNMGLEHITAIVKDNPFKLFQVTTAPQRKKMLEDGDFSIE